MPTAVTHIESVDGFAGPTRCYRMDPPVNFGDVESEYVSICITPARGGLSAEVKAYPAHPTGAVLGHTMQRRAGSFTLHETPATEDYVNGCWFVSLQLLGNYTVEEAAA